MKPIFILFHQALYIKVANYVANQFGLLVNL